MAQCGFEGGQGKGKERLSDYPLRKTRYGLSLRTIFPDMSAFRVTPITAAMSEVQHETVYFTGHVQGVGFRYTTLQVAREYEVAGFVCNLPDGRVQLEVEGEKAEVQSFVQALHDRMHGYVKSVERTSRRRPREFQGFTIH